jgi:hypothetical protein
VIDSTPNIVANDTAVVGDDDAARVAAAYGFLNWWWQLPREDRDGVVVLCERNGTGLRGVGTYRCDESSLQMLAERSVRISGAGDTWYTTSNMAIPPGPGKKGTENRVRDVPGLWADIDKLPDPLGFLDSLGEWAPSVVVGSGGTPNGVHAYWPFVDIVDLTEAIDPKTSVEEQRIAWHNEQYKMRQLTNRFHAWLVKRSGGGRIDNVANLDRVLRLPGTRNHKNGVVGDVRVIGSRDHRFKRADIEALLDREQVTSTFVSSPSIRTEAEQAAAFALQGTADETEAGQLVTRLVPKYVGYANDGHDFGDGKIGRDHAGFYLAQQLNDHYVPRELAYEALRGFTQQVKRTDTQGNDDPLDDDWARAKVDHVYESYPPRGPATAPDQGQEVGTEGEIRLASDIKIKVVRWLWFGRIPLGKITMHDGDPGRGKSLTYVSITGAITTGRPLPGEHIGRQPAGVVIVCAEDDWEDTIAPRLLATGADLSKVATLTLDRDAKGNVVPLTIPKDLHRLRRAIDRVGAVFVVIDPIMAYLGEETNSNNDPSVRRAMMPLKEFAGETGVAVLLVRHMNKNGDLKAEYRGAGSIGFTAQARSALVSEFHPTEKGVLVLAQLKNNLAVLAPSLTYKIEPVDVEQDDVRVRVPIIRWGEAIEMTAQELLRGPDGRKASPEQAECWAQMKELFDEQDRWPAEEMIKLLKDFSISTIKRVRRDKGVGTEGQRDDGGRMTGWVWTAPVGSGREVEELSKRLESWSTGPIDDQ